MKLQFGMVLAVVSGSLAANAQSSGLPSTAEFMNVLTVCGGGSTFKFEGDVRREAASIYEKGRTEGKAVQEILTAIFTQLPEKDRAEAQKTYSTCVQSLLSSRK